MRQHLEPVTVDSEEVIDFTQIYFRSVLSVFLTNSEVGMTKYVAPTEDMEFILFDLLDAENEWSQIPALQGLERGTAKAVLQQSAKVAQQTMAPLSQTGDEEGAHWKDGLVSAPLGFAEAFAEITEGGWLGVSGNPEFGGQGLPKMLSVFVEEMFWGANTNLWLYGTLTLGAGICIEAHADEDTKALYLPKLYQGAWTGAMALTESHCGTDLGLIKTTAQPNPDGTYAITGTKIFITSGDHDLAENIVHLVLAKLPDAPGGTRGISLFLVPKYTPDASGMIDARNGFESASIESKMGVRGSATSVINYDRARGIMLGEPNQGLACMFTMMNYARLSVGLQGLGLGDLAYQVSSAYAKDREQGRAPTGPTSPNQSADAILVHPDVRRMLLTQRAYVEGSRAFSAFVGMMLDRSQFLQDAKATRFVELLTPVAKAFMTDRGMDGALLAQQTFGGHGYIREWGVEQIVRDVRIAQIYEGTNGIQALDLIGRKVLKDGGRTVAELIAELKQEAVLEAFQKELDDAFACWLDCTDWLVANAKEDPNLAGSASVDYLDLAGHVLFAWLWSRMALVGDDSKRNLARFFFDKLLPKIKFLDGTIRAGSRTLMEPKQEWF